MAQAASILNTPHNLCRKTRCSPGRCEPYAIAKIAGIKLCETYNCQYGESHGVDYRSVMPTNPYGPGDNYHPENSHVISALIRRFHEAKANNVPSVTIWGTDTPNREISTSTTWPLHTLMS